MRAWKYVLVFGLTIFSFVYVNANMNKKFSYKAPTNFVVETNYFPSFFPTMYNYNGVERITVLIPPEIKSKIGVPKTKTGELNPSFIQGKLNFNEQFGIEDWKMDNYKFSQTPHGERLELVGSYTSYAGVKTTFIEHHYFGKSRMQSIQLFYPSLAQGKVVEQAKLSLQTFSPNVN
ncbi:MAG: hypothetical protein JNL11_12475 [Bdellovibrionaceae bacterium]|nr:hypothetical protein [Pseudobdellovibrionaceae bacterium]